MKTTLGFFGAGKMAEGILAAAALQKDFDPQAVLMAEKVDARAEELVKKKISMMLKKYPYKTYKPYL